MMGYGTNAITDIRPSRQCLVNAYELHRLWSRPLYLESCDDFDGRAMFRSIRLGTCLSSSFNTYLRPAKLRVYRLHRLLVAPNLRQWGLYV